MMKHEEMIALIDDVFLGAYMAGQAADMSSIERARADRGCLIDEVADLYAELEHESYEREQFENELKTEQDNRLSLYETIRKMDAEIQRLNERVSMEIALTNTIGDAPTIIEADKEV